MTNKTKDAIRSALFEASFVVLGGTAAIAANYKNLASHTE